MRSLVALLCVLTAALAIAVVALYMRAPSSAPLLTSSEVAASTSVPVTRTPVTVDANEWRGAVEKLNRRLDEISSELESFRQARGREPAAPTRASTEEEFRTQHERTILSVLADERDRLAFEATSATIRNAVKAFCRLNQLSEEKEAAVASALVEGQKRADALMRRFAPDGKRPVEGDGVWMEWENAWRELKAWRHAQLSQYLDAVQEEQLLQNLLGTLKY
jgi:hypothetical protein